MGRWEAEEGNKGGGEIGPSGEDKRDGEEDGRGGEGGGGGERTPSSPRDDQLLREESRVSSIDCSRFRLIFLFL